MTNLYNTRPTWLAMAHQKLDHAVCAAYGWSPDISDDEIIANLLELNLTRAAQEQNGDAGSDSSPDSTPNPAPTPRKKGTKRQK